MFLQKIGKKLKKFMTMENEKKKLLKIFSSFPKNIKILDVGCGYGQKIELFRKSDFNDIVGVEINEAIVKKNQERNIECYVPDDLDKNFKDEYFDVILMSHVIEHFSPHELRVFLEKYLKFLKKGGSLIIATPTMTNLFYVDFDHVRPYDPNGLNMFFSDDSQMQFYSKHKMNLEDLYFRRSPFRLKNFKSLYVRKNSSVILRRIPGLINIILIIIFKISGGFIGRVSGWIGEFKKM